MALSPRNEKFLEIVTTSSELINMEDNQRGSSNDTSSASFIDVGTDVWKTDDVVNVGARQATIDSITKIVTPAENTFGDTHVLGVVDITVEDTGEIPDGGNSDDIIVTGTEDGTGPGNIGNADGVYVYTGETLGHMSRVYRRSGTEDVFIGNVTAIWIITNNVKPGYWTEGEYYINTLSPIGSKWVPIAGSDNNASPNTTAGDGSSIPATGSLALWTNGDVDIKGVTSTRRLFIDDSLSISSDSIDTGVFINASGAYKSFCFLDDLGNDALSIYHDGTVNIPGNTLDKISSNYDVATKQYADIIGATYDSVVTATSDVVASRHNIGALFHVRGIITIKLSSSQVPDGAWWDIIVGINHANLSEYSATLSSTTPVDGDLKFDARNGRVRVTYDATRDLFITQHNIDVPTQSLSEMLALSGDAASNDIINVTYIRSNKWGTNLARSWQLTSSGTLILEMKNTATSLDTRALTFSHNDIYLRDGDQNNLCSLTFNDDGSVSAPLSGNDNITEIDDLVTLGYLNAVMPGNAPTINKTTTLLKGDNTGNAIATGLSVISGTSTIGIDYGSSVYTINKVARDIVYRLNVSGQTTQPAKFNIEASENDVVFSVLANGQVNASKLDTSIGTGKTIANKEYVDGIIYTKSMTIPGVLAGDSIIMWITDKSTTVIDAMFTCGAGSVSFNVDGATALYADSTIKTSNVSMGLVAKQPITVTVLSVDSGAEMLHVTLTYK